MTVLVFLLIAAPFSLAFGVFIGNIAAAAPPTSRLYRLRQRLLCLGESERCMCGLNLDRLLFQRCISMEASLYKFIAVLIQS